ncbi:MAG TPA: hypothetical protein VKP60_13635 [Magnetospirillaceae bacterium]|nr:hypothetical protein [Magnetospirillaceae bacterium]
MKTLPLLLLLLSVAPAAQGAYPDLSGIWQALGGDGDIEPHQARPDAAAGLGYVVGEEIPYKPEALEQRRKNFAGREKSDPRNRCFLAGIPRATYQPFPFQIFQSDRELTLVYEYVHGSRTIYTNGSTHPDGHIDWWLGDSRGHWEGDALVVDVVDFNDQTWFDHAGNFHSDQLHVTERWRLLDHDHLSYRATIEDPAVFTKPWSLEVVLYRHVEPNFQLLEYDCFAFDYERAYP